MSPCYFRAKKNVLTLSQGLKQTAVRQTEECTLPNMSPDGRNAHKHSDRAHTVHTRVSSRCFFAYITPSYVFADDRTASGWTFFPPVASLLTEIACELFSLHAEAHCLLQPPPRELFALPSPFPTIGLALLHATCPRRICRAAAWHYKN